MSYVADLTAREVEIIRILNALGSLAGKFVVVGGYAVNAFTSHRFSVDCDLVIASKDLIRFEGVLKQEGYRRGKARKPRLYGARTHEYVKLIGGRRVSADLFADSLVCRQTGGEWGYELVRQNSVEANVIGLTGSAVSLVPRRELLMAMKIHSGRASDLRDAIMLSEGADWRAVAEFAACGSKEKVIKQTASAIETINKKEFPSALRAEFALRSDVTPLIKKTAEGLGVVKKLLSENL